MFLEPSKAWQLLGLCGLCAALVVIFLLTVQFTKRKTKVPLFYSWIGVIAIFGGALAFLLPIALNSGFGKDDDGRVLRQLILYTTGGVLGVITLGETHRKNSQEKEKNENDHTRQVYAERRSRYTKAIEQLADEKAAVRLGGIYTLAGLVDEWLADNTLTKEEQQKEGQVIINNLCSYIRSPFPLALKAEMFEGDSEPDNYEGDFSKDQAAFREEQDVRRTIFAEMSKRSLTVSVNSVNGSMKVTATPGAWSTFGFDFSRAPIFYPLNNLTIAQGQFSSAQFYGKADFQDAGFIGNARFRNAKFTGNVRFRGTRFTRGGDFRGAKFTRNADFWSTDFIRSVSFDKAKFTGDANFRDAKFTGNARFRGTKFTGNTSFNGTYFEKSEPTFADAYGSARFSAQADPEDYVFSVRKGSKPINCGTATFDGKSFEIPLGAVLCDPASWDEEEQDYTRLSEPAK